MLNYIYYIGVISLVSGFIWKWIIVMPYTLLTVVIVKALKLSDNALNLLSYPIKIAGYYINVSLIALITIGTINEQHNIPLMIIYAILGGLILFFGLGSASNNARREFERDYDYEGLEMIKYDGLFIIITMIFYIVALFMPILIINKATLLLYNVIIWVQSLKYIGFIVGIGGFIFLINIIWTGVLASLFIFGSIFSKFNKQSIDS